MDWPTRSRIRLLGYLVTTRPDVDAPEKGSTTTEPVSAILWGLPLRSVADQTLARRKAAVACSQWTRPFCDPGGRVARDKSMGRKISWPKSPPEPG